MESSEDDAGTATNASRRASAREKDVGVAEEVNATSSFQQDQSEPRPSCQTPAMSEDNFDGDSVPSPSAQDVNTSTEAILDMIDEIVDGPGAPKRIPLAEDSVDIRFDELELTSEHSNIIQESCKSHDNNSPLPAVASVDSAESEVSLQTSIDTQPESSSPSDTSHGILKPDSVDSLPESSSVPESHDPAVSIQTENITVSNVVPEVSSIDSLPERSPLPQCEEPAVSTQVEYSTLSNKEPEVSVSCETSIPESSSLSESKESVVSTIPENSDDVSNVEPASDVSSLPESSSLPENDEPAVSVQGEDSTVSNKASEICEISIPESSSLPESDEPALFTQSESCVGSNVVSEVSSLPESSSMPEPDDPAVSTQPEPSEVSNVLPEAHVAPAGCVDSLPESSSQPESNEPAVSIQSEESAVSNVVPEAPASCPPPNIPSSSEERTVQNISDVSECETQERTVKCVSSSDSRDNVTVESAESTSSDSSVSEGRAVLVEPQVRSPLRRRLIRPAPSDRRPDSTVSSTVDSQTVNIPATEQISSENITKDVTSSSDAVPTIHGNVKPEEIRNVSEINFCKAETSVSPPKKIKLIRQKVIAGTSNRESSINQSALQSDKDQCQSTSSDNHSLPLPEPHKESSNTINVSQSQENNESFISVSNCVPEKPIKSPEQAVCLEEHSQPSIEQCDPPKQVEVEKHDDSNQVLPVQPSLSLPNSSEPEVDVNINTHANSSNTVQEISSMPIPSSVEPEAAVKENDIEQVLVSGIDKNEYKDIKSPECAQNEVQLQESIPVSAPIVSTSVDSEQEKSSKEVQEDQKKVPPFKLNLSMSSLPEPKSETEHSSQSGISKNSSAHEETEVIKQVPKLTIKLKQPDEIKSPVPKVTIKPIRPPAEQDTDDNTDKTQHIPSVTKINIKPILKPPDNINEKALRSQHSVDDDARSNAKDQLPCVTKLNIKPIPKPPEKINDIHRKSSSSEISESEYSENDETSTSDQASTSDHGPSDVVPKVTIKLGKPGTESEGKFYTEKNVPKVTIKGFQQDEKDEQDTKLKLVISQSEVPSDSQPEKIPKLTIKTVSKSEGQPLSPKLTIKPLKPPESPNKESEIPKIKISTESFSLSPEVKESQHVPKITIKPVTRSSAVCDSPEHIPVVTKLNIKPILKPTDSGESSEDFDNKVPVVSKLNIKPVIKPKDNDVDSSVEDVPKITKLNIKPIKNPEENSSEEKDCDELNADIDENSIPVVTKINIKPIIKPQDEETLKDSENQSSETGNSSDDNGDHIPVVTKLNIKPIIKPDSLDESSKAVSSSEQSIPVVTKLNIKPLVKPGENISPSSPKKEHLKIDAHSSVIPVVTKLNIKPVVRPEEAELSKPKDDSVEKTLTKNPPLVMKINMKTMTENYNHEHACNNVSEERLSLSPKKKVATALEIKPEICLENKNLKKVSGTVNDLPSPVKDHSSEEKPKQNCIPDSIEKGKESDEKISVIKSPTLSENEKHKQSETAPESVNLVTGSLFPETSAQKEPNDVKANPPSQEHKNINYGTTDSITESSMMQALGRQKFSSVQNCTLLKKLLENTKNSLDKSLEVTPIVNYALPTEKNDKSIVNSGHLVESGNTSTDKTNIGKQEKNEKRSSSPDKINDSNKSLDSGLHTIQDQSDKANESLTKPLEITISDKITNQSSGQDSPRIILKINKTDHGPSAKIITEDVKRPDTQQNYSENTQDIINDKQSPKKYVNSRRKQPLDTSLNLSAGKRLRSSRIVENTEKTPIARRNMAPEEVSQDPLDVKPTEEPPEIIEIPKPVELTPQPKKRGRPRKLPVSEGAKPAVTLPVPALEERPQRSLRLMRDRPAILQKPRGRGRGRGGRRAEATPPTELETIVVIEPADEPEDRPATVDIDPTSSRIKLPRMTEALDKMPNVCVTPLSSRRRNSSGNFSTGETPDVKVVLESSKLEELGKSPEAGGSGKGRGGRGARGGRGRTPRGRGRGRGGGRGAMYMKETLGIYGRVCGPATTTVQLFEEETCMMDDNATPAKPSHLLDEDSQSSVKSSTNESNKLKKSKFADLFDSNKVWTAADVKEYTWPPPDRADGEHKVMMIQEQVAMFLGVKSFKRRYAELKRRTISGEERDYVLSKGLVTEALCDLGITAVDASDVLDIMLSDYPHKYEEYRSHQRQRQLQAEEEPPEDVKPEERIIKVEMKAEKVEHKPDLPKIDPEKTRQDMAAAAIASASEWNARTNALRRGACADLQSLTVQRARPPALAPPHAHLRPPAGFYPHALLPGQYQHSYRIYTPDQLRYFPLNTVLAAPPAPPSEEWSSESEPDWADRLSSSDDSDVPTHHAAKRKKLTKTKRSSQTETASSIKEEPRGSDDVELCRVCKMRLEANRKYTHERFLTCANCNAKLHPSCLELNADTIRKCREYAWQCAECKTCCSCRQPADDDKMLFCDLCDRGFHIYCVGLDQVPSGRWHCVECAVCKSCGARSPAGAAGAGGASAGGAAGAPEWHHQTRRGPGGHKVYSHSLCTPCARAYRIGRYCPLCERSFIGPKGTMQLVICKLCDRQLHQDCVRQTVSSLNVLDYTCAECRRGGITSRAAAVRLAPRTIATLFMAKRRFNKYAHRQYMESRRRSLARGDDAAPLLVDVERDSDASDAPADHDTSDPLDAAPDA
ncbi:hypothetical protein PYW08_011693 [Mythimna loreyi]|uniref:Uncharacterized protein n=1 Tax=Mythimna loreyi TaxID=667449 RepID=A0ACC2QMQ7_9NEOP|nr:hypothetical protein PYW08_011693 [Mythimna loreyi]